MPYLLSMMTFVPLLGALVVLCVPSAREKWIRAVALVATLIPLALAVFLTLNFDRAQSAPQFVERVAWIPSLNAQYFLGVDGQSVLMVLLTALLSVLGLLASWNVRHMVKGYFVMFLLLHVGMMGVFCALDLFLFYVFWELMLFPMYFLIGVWGGERREYAALKFFLYTLLGSVFMLIGVLALYFYSARPEVGADAVNGVVAKSFDILHLATLDWTHASIPFFGYSLPFDFTVWWLLFVAFAVKIPLFPFHTWLPWAHVQAPTGVSMLLAGVLLKTGAYGLLRLNFGIFPEASTSLSYFLIVLGVVNILYGALCALAQKDLKKLVAYSSISHMGYAILGMASLTPLAMNGAVLQLFNHGVLSAMLFMLVGALYDRLGHREIVTASGELGFGGVAQKSKSLTAFWTLAVFASLGLPTLSSFVSEMMIFLGSFQVYREETLFAVLGLVLGAAYFLWMMQRVFLGPYTAQRWNAVAARFEPASTVSELNLREWCILLPLAALTLAVGIFPQPFLNLIQSTLNEMVEMLRQG